MIVLYCPRHRRYTARRAPNCACDVCWTLFNVARGNMHTAAADSEKAAKKQSAFKVRASRGSK